MGAKQEDAFVQLKKVLSQEPVLKMFNPEAETTELHTDACAYGLAGMLFQRDTPLDKLRLVHCVSKRLTEAEQHYHSSKLELMAMVWSVKRLRSYLLGIQYMIPNMKAVRLGTTRLGMDYCTDAVRTNCCSGCHGA